MKELEWIKELEEELKEGKELACDWELYCWENFTKSGMKAKIKELKKRAKNEAQPFAAANSLGDLYYLGCEAHKVAVNYSQAIFWFRQAARYGNAHRGEALCKLAYCYKYGRGKNRDRAKAFKMFEALAKIDDCDLPVSASFTEMANFELNKMIAEGEND